MRFWFVIFGFIGIVSCNQTEREFRSKAEDQSTGNQAIILDKGWKFRPGDDPAWAMPDFDDSAWDSINVADYWEHQGYDTLDGLAWYRYRFFLPSSLKNLAFLKDSLQISLGKIDDVEQFYLNGTFIGQNSRRFEVAPPDSMFLEESDFVYAERRFLFASDDPVLWWDRENVIAVRVNDQREGGGLYTGVPAISMIDISDRLIIDKATYPYIFDEEQVFKTFVLKNTSQVELNGTFVIESLEDGKGDLSLVAEYQASLGPREMIKFPSVVFQAKEEVRKIRLTFRHSDSRQRIMVWDEVPYILTPEPGDAPRINGARLVGMRPGNPFLFTIPVSGKRPVTFSAWDLPPGLFLDATTGIISGMIREKGEYHVNLSVENQKGKDTRTLRLRVGEELALTPPLGWNGYNSWCGEMNDSLLLEAAHACVEKGLINHGWTYINLDDGWQAQRDGSGEIQSNANFNNMKALADSIHHLGLKFGIHSSPGPQSCGGYVGSYQHEYQDAATYARWGVDYLKYDWCSYRTIAKDRSLPELKKPYEVMQGALLEVDRDIVYSLCQYGMGDVWEWGAEVGGHLWRTSYDVTDTWESVSEIGFAENNNAAFAGPGHWNDLDMMVVGWVGWGPDLYPSRLTVDEQYTHVSLWALLASPMIFGCDLNRLDDFTLNLITNDEVMDVNQDPLGRQAIQVIKREGIRIYLKELEDGSKAVGLFNLNPDRRQVILDMEELGLGKEQSIRDLWRQKELGAFDGTYTTSIPAHGVVLIKLIGKK